MNTNILPKRYLAMSRTVVHNVPTILNGRGLEPRFSDWLITSHQSRVWLFGVLDVANVGRLERYTDPGVLHHLSTALRGLPVFLSNSNGLRYAFLLSQRPRLPRRIDLPGQIRRGTAMIGVDAGGAPATVAWSDLGHVLVAGMTRSGKSNFLRLLTWQILREQGQVILADIDNVTFPMLEDHPALLAPIAHTPEEVAAVIGRALGECDRRADLYANTPGYPETLEEYNQAAEEPLPRLLVVLDEFNATVTALGGARGAFARDAASLAWRGLKFGVNLVFAAQEFSKAVVGRVRDQVRATVCFRVRSAQIARTIGCAGAENIPESIPGRAITDRWGPLQAYYLDKELLIAGAPRGPLDDDEISLVTWALEQNEGYLPLSAIETHGWSNRDARRLGEEWENRGWLEQDPNRSNCRQITPALRAIIEGGN